MKLKKSTKNRVPQWQLEKMQMLIVNHWDEMWHIVNLRASRENQI